MTTYEKNLQARKNERIRIAKEGGDVQAYLRNERNAALTRAAKAETKSKDYQLAKSVETPMLDASVGNTPDFVAPSSGSGSERKLTNEEQALEIMGLLNPVDFSPEAVAEREWKAAGVKNADEYRKVLPGIVQKDMNDLGYFFREGALLAAESGLENTVSSVAEAGRGVWDYLSNSYKYGETEESKTREDVVSPFLLGFADEHAQASQDAMDTAKANMTGTVGDVLLDATAAGTQMVGDFVVSVATGGSSKVPMAIRAFGSGVQAARNKGYTLEQQMALGLGSAATEWATEKLFGGNPLYDAANSGVVNKVISKVTQNENILKFLASRPIETLNEGLEEILSGVINPAIELAITGNADWPTVEELIRDGAIGVALGGAGQVVNAVANRGNESSGNPLYDALTAKENAVTGESATAGGQYKTGASHSADANAPAPTANTANVTTPVVGAVNAADAGAPAYTAEPEGSPTPTVATVSQTEPVVNGSAPYHPINEAGAASAQATYGRDPVQVPVTNFEGHLTSKTGSTVINSGLTPNGVAQSLIELYNKGELSRLRFTDADAVADAKRTIAEKGFAKALEEFKIDVANGKRGKGLMAKGIELFNMAAQSGDIMTATDIAVDIVDSAREQAQAIQVLNLFNKATPEGRVYFAVKGMDKLISKMEKKYGDRAKGIKVNEGLLSNYYEAVKSGNEQAIKETWSEVQQDVANQIPANWADKFRAWRYLSMLGNPRTHVRNVAGNVVFMPARYAKNVIGAGIEKISGTSDRTKAVLNPLSAQDRQLMQLAWQDYAAAMDGTDTGRYDESTDEIDRMRQVLPGALDKVAKWNTEQMAKEDRWFSQPAYMDALAGWFKANNITPNQAADILTGKTDTAVSKSSNLRDLERGETVRATDRDNYGKVVKNNGDGTYMVHFVSETGHEADVNLPRSDLRPTKGKNGTSTFNISEATPSEILAEAREYAIREAKRATFQDVNAFSDAIVRFGRSSKGAKFIADTVLPFKRTPANVLMRATEYSPAYLMKGLKELAVDVPSGKLSAAEAVDHLASGLTGSGIMGLGLLLAKMGLLRGSGSDDEKQAAFDKLQGKQDYSLAIGDTSYTIDWMAPAALPLFVGAELYELMTREEEEAVPTEEYINAALSIADPILETSMLSGVNDLINSVGYSDTGIWDVIKNIAFNYVGSFLPTIGGQIERMGDENRQETYRYNESDFLSKSQYDVANLLNKIPGIDSPGQIDYVDAWGRTQENTNPLFNQMFNPSYVSTERTSEVETELQRLYDRGQTNVFPQRRKQSEEINVLDADGEFVKSRHLTAEEYEQFNRTKGQTSLRLISDLMKSRFYRSASDSEKAEAIGNIYDYANAIAKMEAEPTTTVSGWIEKAKESGNPGKYIELYTATQNIEPMPGNENPSAWQKVEYIVGNTSTKDADEFIPLYLDTLGPRRYEMAREHGYTPEMFAQAYKANVIIESDRDENGKSLKNVKDKYVKYLMEEYGWPEANAKQMYKFIDASAEKLDNWTW